MLRKITNYQKFTAQCSVRNFRERHFPNEVVTVKYPKPKSFDEVKDDGPAKWPYYGGRISVSRKWKQKFPQVLPIKDTTPIDIRSTQVDRTVRFGTNPRTYPTLLVYPDGSTITIPYHKPVGTIYLPGDDTQISLGIKTKAKVKRRIKIGL